MHAGKHKVSVDENVGRNEPKRTWRAYLPIGLLRRWTVFELKVR